jgi:hypothetical protein
MLTEERADPINPRASPFNFDTDSLFSSVPLSEQAEQAELVAEASTASNQANPQGARPAIAKSLLARLHHIFSTKEVPGFPGVEKDRPPQSLSGQSNNPGSIATNFSTQLADAVKRPGGSALANLPLLSLEQEPVTPRISGQPGIGTPSDNDVTVTSPIDALGFSLLPASSSTNEEFSPTSTETKATTPTFERDFSTHTAANRPDNLEQEATAASVTAPSDPGSAPRQRASSSLIECVSPNSNNIEPVLPILGEGQSRPILPGPLHFENVKRAEGPDAEGALLPSDELPPLIFSTATRPLGSNAISSEQVLSGQSDSLAPAEVIVSAATTSNAENAQSQLPRSLRLESAPPASTDTGSSLYLQTEPSPAEVSGRSKDMMSAASPVALSARTIEESALPQRLRKLLAELTPTVPPDPTPPRAAAENETFPSTLSTQLSHPQPAEHTDSSSESAVVQPWETERLLSEILSPASSTAGSHPFVFENETSPIAFVGELDCAAPAINPVAAPPPVHAAAEQSRSLPPTDLAAFISTSSPIYEQNALSPSPPHQPESVEPPVRSFVAAQNEEGALPRHIIPLLTALRVLNTKPSSPLLEKAPFASTRASEPGKAEMSGETIAHPSGAESAKARTPKLLPEMPSAVSTDAKLPAPAFEKDRWRPPVSDRPADDVPTVQSAVVAPSAYAESVVTRAQHANSLLDELDLNTAIQLRWAMRDIRSKRTKFSPVSDNDLTALVNLGLVEMRDGLPRLTGLGVIALD